MEILDKLSLKDLVEASLFDGKLTEEERQVILDKAAANGEDPKAYGIYLEYLLQKKEGGNKELRCEMLLNEFRSYFDDNSSIVFEQLKKAIECYDNDPEKCCVLFRHVLTAFLNTIIKLIGRSDNSDSNEFISDSNKIFFLDNNLPKDLLPLYIVNSMHDLRKLCNRYHHLNEDAPETGSMELDPLKDRECMVGYARSICLWLSKNEEKLKELSGKMIPGVYNLDIRTEQNAKYNSQTGILIHLDFTVEKFKDEKCWCTALFYHKDSGQKDSRPLKDLNGKYCTKKGQVCTTKSFTPSNENCNYKDFKLFIPYNELHLEDEEYPYFLSYIVNVFCGDKRFGSTRMGITIAPNKDEIHVELPEEENIIDESQEDDNNEKEVSPQEEQRINELYQLADQSIDDENYIHATNILKQIDSEVGLDEYGLLDLAICCNCRGEYEELDCVFESWREKYGQNGEFKYDMLKMKGNSLYYSNKDAKSALAYYKESYKYLDNSNGEDVAFILYKQARCYQMLGETGKAIEYFKESISIHEKTYDINEKKILKGLVKDELLGAYLFFYANILNGTDKIEEGETNMIMSAACDFQEAIDYCKKHSLKIPKTSLPLKIYRRFFKDLSSESVESDIDAELPSEEQLDNGSQNVIRQVKKGLTNWIGKFNKK